MPKIDWNNVSDEGFIFIPEGTYPAQIIEVTESETKNKDDMWKLKFKIISGEYAGKTVLSQLVFNDGGYGNIKKLYSVIYGSKLPKNCQTSDILEEKVNIDVVHNEYNGKTYANIAYAGFSSIDDEEEAPF